VGCRVGRGWGPGGYGGDVWGGVMIIGDAMILDPCFRDPGI